MWKFYLKDFAHDRLRAVRVFACSELAKDKLLGRDTSGYTDISQGIEAINELLGESKSE